MGRWSSCATGIAPLTFGMCLDQLCTVQKIIERGQPVDGPPGPIIVCTRNDDLQGVLDSTPKDRREGSVLTMQERHHPCMLPATRA